MTITPIVRLAAALFCLNLGGCAVMNPYVQPERVGGKWNPAPLVAADTRSLDDARDYAGAWAATYRKAAVDHSTARTTLGVGLIALNTFGLFTAATRPVNDGSDLMPAIGFGSSGALNIAGLLVSSPRQAVYLMGSQTMLCARSRTDGYDLSGQNQAILSPTTGYSNVAVQLKRNMGRQEAFVQADLEAARRNIKSLTDQINAITARTPAARARIRQLEDLRAPELRKQVWISRSISRANKVRARSAKLENDLNLYAVRRDRASTRLYADVDRIAAEIDRQIQRTEPDIASIRQALSASSLASLRDLPVAPATKAPVKAEGAAAGSRTLPDGLGQAHVAYADAIDDLEDAVSAGETIRDRLLAAEQGAETSSECMVAGLVGLSIMPPTQSLTAGEGELRISIFTTAGAPAVQVDGDAAGITWEVLSTDAAHNGYQVRLKAEATTRAGQRWLIARSSDGLDTQKASFTVDAPAAAPDAPEAPAEDQPAAADGDGEDPDRPGDAEPET